MPILNVSIAGAPEPARAARIAAALLGLTAVHLGKDPALTAVALTHIPAQHWYVGGQQLAGQEQPSAFVSILVTAGTNTAAQKSAWIGAVVAALSAELGQLHRLSYVHVHEVPADSWGYGGLTQLARAAARATG